MQATQVAVPVRDAGDAVGASFANALNILVSALPRVLGFVVILGVGWFLASLLAKGLVALLHAARFNELARRSGFADFVQKMGVRQDASGVIASVAKWFVRLIALVVAFDQLGLPAVSQVLQQFVLWLPNLVVALVVLVLAGLAATALGNLVCGATAEAGFSDPDTLATVARVAVWAFGIVVAVNQIGVATTLINTLLIGVVGALALASGLAFGLGGRDRAARLLDDWSRQAAQAGPKVARAAEAAERQGPRMAAPPAQGHADAGTMRAAAPAAAPPRQRLRAVPGAPVQRLGSAEDWDGEERRSGDDRRRVPRATFDRRIVIDAVS